MSKKETAHPRKKLRPHTTSRVAERLGISRTLAYYRLDNADEEAWAIALQIENEQTEKERELARKLEAAQGIITAEVSTTAVPH